LASGTTLRVDLLNPAELGCPHHHTLTPGDLLKVQGGGVIAAIGVGYEPYLERIRAAVPQVKIMEIASGAPLLPAVDVESEPFGNPHLFTCPSGLAHLTRALAKRMREYAVAEQSIISHNESEVVKQLGQMEVEWQGIADSIVSMPVIVTHDSLDYLCRDLGLGIVARLEESEGEGLSVARLLALKRDVSQKGVRAILVDSQHETKAAATIARETGVPVLAVDTLTQGPTDGADLYLRLRRTAAQIRALSGLR
ncbi:MAG TPA: metal ABC transporter substrate-binding protein, partial [Candidatus Ozemobacteraceae bacterium]|nr:metal ABC transporter substrate-binding protein [Candidatus Ozemobacteraceae bacterium]